MDMPAMRHSSDNHCNICTEVILGQAVAITLNQRKRIKVLLPFGTLTVPHYTRTNTFYISAIVKSSQLITNTYTMLTY